MTDGEKIMQELVNLATQNPDKVYRRPQVGDKCYYTRDCDGGIPGENGCIFGRALYNLYPDKLLKCILDPDGQENGVQPIPVLLRGMSLDLSTRETDLFNIIQQAQDGGKSWAEILLCHESDIKREFPDISLEELK